MRVQSKYRPRPHFSKFHRRTNRWAVLVAHRRAGKTVAAINDLIEKATYNTREFPRYAYIAPFRTQAKDIAWVYLKSYASPFNPKINESELWVELSILPNSPRISLYGADNPDSFRGLYFDGVVLDEFGNMRASVWKEVLLPALIDRRGWAVFMGTPNGPNHFRDMWYDAIESESWFTEMLPIHKTNIISDEDLEEMRKIMDEEQYAQEMLCSFEASVRGAIYARQVEQMIQENRVGPFPLDHISLTDVVFDLGHSDSTVMGFVQRRPDGILLGHAHGDNMKPIAHYISYMQDYWSKNNLRPGRVWLPHDARARSLQTGKSIVDHFIKANLKPRIVPNLDILDGIAAARKTWPLLFVNEPLCKKWILAAKSYHREYDEEKKVYDDKPVHDWSSDWMDMTRYLAIVQNPQAREPIKHPKRTVDPDAIVGQASYGFCLNEIWDLTSNSSRRPYG